MAGATVIPRPFMEERDGEFAITDMRAAIRFVGSNGYGKATAEAVRLVAGLVALTLEDRMTDPAFRVSVEAQAIAVGWGDCVAPGRPEMTADDVISTARWAHEHGVELIPAGGT